MKAQTKFFTAAAATAIAGLVSAAPAQAITFGSGLIQGDGSNVHFTFHESHNWFESEWGVYNKTTDTFHTLFDEVLRNDPGKGGRDNMGTCGITVVDCEASFTFQENNEYSFFLKSVGNNPLNPRLIFSANELNQDRGGMKFENQTKFLSDLSVLNDTRYQTNNSPDSDLANWASENVTLKNGVDSLIAFEDSGLIDGEYQHGDWNDFLVTATVPEPATLLGLGVVAGAMTLSRRRKNDKAA